MGIEQDEALAIFQGQQECIDAVTEKVYDVSDKVSKLEEIVERIEKQNEKNINLVTTSIGEIRHLPKDVEKGAQVALREQIDKYIDNLPNATFKRLSTAVENSQREVQKQNIELTEEIEKTRKANEEFAEKNKALSKKFYGLLIPALIATILNIVSTFYNVTVVQNAITTANNVIANANSTIQQYNSTLNSAIPKIPEVAQTTGIEPWQAIIFSLLVISSIIFIFIKNNSH